MRVTKWSNRAISVLLSCFNWLLVSFTRKHIIQDEIGWSNVNMKLKEMHETKINKQTTTQNKKTKQKQNKQKTTNKRKKERKATKNEESKLVLLNSLALTLFTLLNFPSTSLNCWWCHEEAGENHRHGQATGKLYHLRLRVECTFFVIYKAGREPMPYWW